MFLFLLHCRVISEQCFLSVRGSHLPVVGRTVGRDESSKK